MRLLLSNDDGFDAPGLQALVGAMGAENEVWVSAPATQRSAQSHAFGLGQKIKIVHRGDRQVAVGGSPADAVYYGLHRLLSGVKPDWVVSGINAGSNLGTDVHYSGTVGAAMEAHLYGISAVAISLHGVERDPDADFQVAADLSVKVLAYLRQLGLTKPTCWNLNVPNVPERDLRGIRMLRLSRRVYETHVNVLEKAKDYEWVKLGGVHSRFDGGGDADGPCLFDGFATLTPLRWDWTNDDLLQELQKTTQKDLESLL